MRTWRIRFHNRKTGKVVYETRARTQTAAQAKEAAAKYVPAGAEYDDVTALSISK